MPQMAPMNWLTLFFMFIMVLLLFNSLNYFSFIYTPKSKKQSQTSFSINWKW